MKLNNFCLAVTCAWKQSYSICRHSNVWGSVVNNIVEEHGEEHRIVIDFRRY